MQVSKPSRAVLCCLGSFALYWCWNFCVLVSGSFTMGLVDGLFGNVWLWSSVAHAATIVVFGLRAHARKPYAGNLLVLSGGPTCTAAGLCLLLAASPSGLPPEAAVLTGSLLVGVGTGCLVVPWAELFTACSLAPWRDIMLLVALSVCAAANALFALAPLPLQILVALAMPLACAALVHAGMQARPAAGTSPDADGARASSSDRAVDCRPCARDDAQGGRGTMTHSLGWRFYANCLVYTLPLGFFQTWFHGDNGGAGRWVAIMLVSAAVLTAVTFADACCVRKSGSSRIQGLVLPLTVAGLFALTLVGDASVAVPGTFIFIATQLLSATLYPSFASVSEKLDVPPARTFGLGIAATDAGYAVGMLVGYGLELLPGNAVLGAVLGIAYLVVMAAFLQARRGGVEFIAPLPHAPSDVAVDDSFQSKNLSSALRQAVAAISVERGLTEREREVLEYLLGGKTAAGIGDEMGLSANTVRTHTAHVYQKLGVHGKDQLIAAVEAWMGQDVTNGGNMPVRRPH